MKMRRSFAYAGNPLESKELTFLEKKLIALYLPASFLSHLKPVYIKAFKETIVQFRTSKSDASVENRKSLLAVIIYTSNDAIVSITDAVHQ